MDPTSITNKRTYQHLLVYYFTGTGNAQTTAKWIKEYGEGKVQHSSIQAIDKIERLDLRPLEGRSLFAFVYPTHGFAPPWIMLKFLWNFPRLQHADVLFVNTKAGAKLWKFYFPGMTGLAQWLPILLFYIKGFSIKGSLPLDVPHSWTSFFPPNPRSSYPPMLERCHRIVSKMCEHVFSGKRYFRYTVWTQLWFDVSVSWIVPLYIVCGRFFLAKTLFSSYQCNGCKLCATHCPVGAIEMRNNMPYWKYTCESCMRCMNICPKRSIQSWITRIMILFYALTFGGIALTGWNEYLVLLITSALFFPIYTLLIKLLHNKLINILFTFTSLTRFWGRYLAPGIKPKDLK